MKRIILFTSVFSFLFTGCSNLPATVKALSGDQAFVTVRVTNPIYGSATIVRDGRPQNGDQISAEGAVTSTPPVVVQVQTNSPIAKP